MTELIAAGLKLVSENDVYDHEGQPSVKFMHGGTLKRLSSSSAARAVETANKFIKDEHRTAVLAPQYSAAVKTLCDLALGGKGSGSHAAAQVLLSCWNGDNYHLNATGLGNLDAEYFEAALMVLRGRVQVWEEPQNVIEGGDDIFDKLVREWGHLRTDRRYSDLYEQD